MAETRDEYTRQLQQSRSEIESLDRSIQIDSEKRREIENQLSTHKQQIKRIDKNIGQLRKRIAGTEQKLKRLEADLVIQRRNTQIQKRHLAEQLRSAYRMGRFSGVQLILSQDNPETFSRLAVYADYYSRAREKKISSALYSVQKLAETRLQAARSRKSLLANKQKLLGSKKVKAAEEESHNSLLSQLKSGIIAKKDQIFGLKANIAKLQSLMDELDRQQLRLKKGFAKEQGELPWPVKGHLVAEFGQAKYGGKLRWNGMFFEASEGEEIRAIAEGETVYADWLNGFGMLLIINHGNGFMSLYGNNRDLLTDTGQSVAKGQVIATVGNSSGQTLSGLYFEIRENAIPIDPGEWISPQIQFAKTGILEAQ